MIDLTGNKYGNLEVIGFSHKKPHKTGYTYLWKVRCLLCGKEKTMQRSNLMRKCQKACGCLRKWTKERFINFVTLLPATESDCKIWPFYTRPNGYAYTTFQLEPWGVHRLSYWLHSGVEPQNYNVCHVCDIRNCINPNHLFLGTTEDNMQDAYKKNRTQKGEKNAASILTAADVIRMRRVIDLKEKTYKELAEEHGVSYACVWDAVNRSWKHIEEEG
jgi:hypothetical protein